MNDAEARFRHLLTSPSSSEWKRISTSSDSSSAKKGKARASTTPELADVVVHRKPSKSGEDVYRLVVDVPTTDEFVSLEPWKAVLSTPELRQEWDPAVEEAHLVEIFDHTARICKTNFTLGWPAKYVSTMMSLNLEVTFDPAREMQSLYLVRFTMLRHLSIFRPLSLGLSTNRRICVHLLHMSGRMLHVSEVAFYSFYPIE